MSRSRPSEILRDCEAWFREKDIGIFVTLEGAEYWANLISLRSLLVFAPRYGRGLSAEAAVQDARHRYLTEEG